MSTHESRRDEVEEILALAPDATAAEAAALVTLFSTAAGPALTGELQGEAAALDAFRAAQPGPSPAARFRAAAFTVKAAVAALAITSVGGVALAATTEVLPAPLTIKSHSADPKPTGTDRPDKPADSASDSAAVRDAAKAAAATDRAEAKAGRANAASFTGLCQAFTARGLDNGRAAETPAFARLVAAAPQGDVAAFCTALAAETPAAKTPPGKGNAPTTGNGKSAEAREKAAENDKPADAGEKSNGKPDATPKTPKAKEPTGNGKADDAQRSQRSR